MSLVRGLTNQPMEYNEFIKIDLHIYGTEIMMILQRTLRSDYAMSSMVSICQKVRSLLYTTNEIKCKWAEDLSMKSKSLELPEENRQHISTIFKKVKYFLNKTQKAQVIKTD